ncbi:FCD domain-containing protein [Nocardioides sp. 1609]|uniref:FadR/GntR family transcriptional regulator n=1 Tax=Nocardioides sp. 1609 TaxID=2508327 RepID=UPI00106F132F|nr:FCD domain-containing protein [Nocardioides sp. 1609]
MTNDPVLGQHAGVLDALGARIASGTGAQAAGSVLTLDGICTTYGVSRSVAREAIRVLESMGLVASRRRVGITIQPQSRWNVLDPQVIRWRLAGDERDAQLASLSELRRGIEPTAAALAAGGRASAHHCRILAAAVSDMVVHGRDGDLGSYLLADSVFHRTLLEASGNEMLRSLGGVVTQVLVGRTQYGMMPSRPKPEAIALHDEVARAVRLGDPVTAERAMRDIIAEAAEALADEQSGDA